MYMPFAGQWHISEFQFEAPLKFLIFTQWQDFQLTELQNCPDLKWTVFQIFHSCNKLSLPHMSAGIELFKYKNKKYKPEILLGWQNEAHDWHWLYCQSPLFQSGSHYSIKPDSPKIRELLFIPEYQQQELNLLLCLVHKLQVWSVRIIVSQNQSIQPSKLPKYPFFIL